MTERKRKALMVDASLAEAVKTIASRYGMSISSYMRSLLTSVLDAESRGIYAPAAITRYTVLKILGRLGVAPIPLELLAATSREDARRIGERLGAALKSLGVRGLDLLAVIAETVPGASLEGDQLVVVDTGARWVDKVLGFIEGLAAAIGFRVVSRGETLVVDGKGDGAEQSS